MVRPSRPHSETHVASADDASAVRALSVIGLTGMAGLAVLAVLGPRAPMTALPADLPAIWLVAIYTGLQSVLLVSWGLVCRYAVVAAPHDHQRQRVLLTVQAAIVLFLVFLALQAASRTFWSGYAILLGSGYE